MDDLVSIMPHYTGVCTYGHFYLVPRRLCRIVTCFPRGMQCFCGSASDDPTKNGEATCDMDCSGDDTRICGGRDAISVYQYDESPYVDVGCYVDDATRVLTGESQAGNPYMTTEVRRQMTTLACGKIMIDDTLYAVASGRRRQNKHVC